MTSSTTAKTKPTGTPVFVKCGRCNGTGRVSSIVDNGICWGCNGTKGQWGTVEDEARKAKNRARAAAKRMEKELARREAFVTGYLRDGVESGMSLEQVHDERCMCRNLCWATRNDGEMAARWVALGGTV